jgi:hypothetical protein
MRKYIYLAVVIAAGLLATGVAGYLGLSREAYRAVVGPKNDVTGSSTVGFSSLIETRIPTSTASSATAEPTGDGTASWKTCRSKKYGYEIEYPLTWTAWAPGPPEARPATCDEDMIAIFWGPDIYSTLYPVQLNLYIYDQRTARGTAYEGKKSLDDYLSSDVAKGKRIVRETLTPDGERLLWFEENQLLSFHDGVFYEFRAHGIDAAFLIDIMTTFRFIR